MKRKIAFVGNSSQTMCNFRLGVMSELVRMGYEVVVIAPKDSNITAFKQNQIRLKVRNRGKGSAINCEAYIRMSGTTNGIHIETVKLPQINPGKEHEVVIPISTDINTQDGNVTFAIEVYVPRWNSR